MTDPQALKVVLYPIETNGNCGFCEREDEEIQLAVLPGNKNITVCSECEEKFRTLCAAFNVTVVKGENLYG